MAHDGEVVELLDLHQLHVQEGPEKGVLQGGLEVRVDEAEEEGHVAWATPCVPCCRENLPEVKSDNSVLSLAAVHSFIEPFREVIQSARNIVCNHFHQGTAIFTLDIKMGPVLYQRLHMVDSLLSSSMNYRRFTVEIFCVHGTAFYCDFARGVPFLWCGLESGNNVW